MSISAAVNRLVVQFLPLSAEVVQLEITLWK